MAFQSTVIYFDKTVFTLLIGAAMYVIHIEMVKMINLLLCIKLTN